MTENSSKINCEEYADDIYRQISNANKEAVRADCAMHLFVINGHKVSDNIWDDVIDMECDWKCKECVEKNKEWLLDGED